MSFEAQTPRRSKRYQPLVATASTSRYDSELPVTFLGEAIFTRDAKPDDLHDEDCVVLDGETAQTCFYGGFLRLRQALPKRERGESETGKNEEFRVGDTVLVQTQSRLPSIGVIVAIWEVAVDDEENESRKHQKVKVHWFLRPNELATVRAKRDHEENEIYFSLANTAILSPHSVIQRCSVTSKRKATASKKGKTSAASQCEFSCFCAIDARRGLYYKLDWGKHSGNALTAHDVEGTAWEVVVKVKGGKKVRMEEADEEQDSEDEFIVPSEGENESQISAGEASSDEDSEPKDEELEVDDILKTPSKKRRRKAPVTTPRRKRTKSTIAAPTPHSKAALRARAKTKRGKFKPAPETAYEFMGVSKAHLPENAWLRVMQVLHVGARPDVLPCREKEYGQIMRAVEGLLEEGSGGCVYVSGVPGTGKTATVHRIVRELKRMAERNEANPFTYVEINGLKIPEASAAYSLLWEAVSGHDVASDGHLKISAKEALKQLTKYFSAGVRQGPGGHACIVLMDELDQLLTTKQEVVYNFFNWPTLVGSKLIVIAVANTHDLPERVMTGRVRSRLGMTRINYEPYKKPQLVEIVNARLDAAKEDYKGDFPEVLSIDSIGFAAAKVASISGDARRVLDICRRAVELVRPLSKPAKIADVKEVITRMQSSLTACYLGDCSLHERIMLAALVKCVLKTGVMEIAWGDVQHQHMIFTPVLAGHGESPRVPNAIDLKGVLDGLLATHAVLIEDASGSVASRKPEAERKLMLNFEQSEVQRVLGDMGGNIWKRALGV